MCLVCVNICLMNASINRGQKRASESLGLELQGVVSHPPCLVETKLWASAWTA